MLEKIYTNKYLEWIISFIVLLPVSISFILSPLTNDSKIYQGLAKMSDYFGSFPANIDLVWEPKPISNRMINYILYKISSIFTTFGTPEYEMMIKLLSLIIVIVICYYFSTKINKKYIFLLITMSFITTFNFVSIQAEWWACLFAFLSLGLFLTEKSSNHYLAGAIVTVIFLFKGITILLVISIACALYLMKPNWFNRLKYGALGSILFLWFILVWNAFKNIIPDLLLSSKIARVGHLDIFTMIIQLIYNTFNIYLYIPIVICGIAAAFILFYTMMKSKDLKSVVVFILMWASAFFIVFMQSEFFVYHYVVLLVPSIITIILLSDNMIKYSILIMTILFILFTSFWGASMQIEREFWGQQYEVSKEILEQLPDIRNQDSILYMETGNAPYYFWSNSTTRYVTPLPFQRNSDEWNLEDTYQYQEEKESIMNYSGKYIIVDPNNWMIKNTTDNKNFWKKITGEYELVWNKNWKIYRRI